MELTQQYLKSRLHYDKHTGVFTWINGPDKQTNKFSIAGCKENGYIRIFITINNKPTGYRAHRLAWLYEYGGWPKKHIDHINHNRSDNRIINLREVDYKDNSKNQTKYTNNKSRFNGVSWAKNCNKWRAIIRVNKTKIDLGVYADKNEAICARLHANRLYKFHSNHGK